MPAARALPASGSVFVDPRGGGRALRVSWHHEAGLVVLSLWRDNVCAGSFRLDVADVPDLVALLRAVPPPSQRERPSESAWTTPRVAGQIYGGT